LCTRELKKPSLQKDGLLNVCHGGLPEVEHDGLRCWQAVASSLAIHEGRGQLSSKAPCTMDLSTANLLRRLTNETHEVAQRKIAQMSNLRAALGLGAASEEPVEGQAFDRDLQEAKRQQRIAEREAAKQKAEAEKKAAAKAAKKAEKEKKKAAKKAEKEQKKAAKQAEKDKKAAEAAAAAAAAAAELKKAEMEKKARIEAAAKKVLTNLGACCCCCCPVTQIHAKPRAVFGRYWLPPVPITGPLGSPGHSHACVSSRAGGGSCSSQGRQAAPRGCRQQGGAQAPAPRLAVAAGGRRGRRRPLRPARADAAALCDAVAVAGQSSVAAAARGAAAAARRTPRHAVVRVFAFAAAAAPAAAAGP
jgi:hypothetical protein